MSGYLRSRSRPKQTKDEKTNRPTRYVFHESATLTKRERELNDEKHKSD